MNLVGWQMSAVGGAGDSLKLRAFSHPAIPSSWVIFVYSDETLRVTRRLPDGNIGSLCSLFVNSVVSRMKDGSLVACKLLKYPIMSSHKTCRLHTTLGFNVLVKWNSLLANSCIHQGNVSLNPTKKLGSEKKKSLMFWLLCYSLVQHSSQNVSNFFFSCSSFFIRFKIPWWMVLLQCKVAEKVNKLGDIFRWGTIWSHNRSVWISEFVYYGRRYNFAAWGWRGITNSFVFFVCYLAFLWTWTTLEFLTFDVCCDVGSVVSCW